MDDEHPDPSCIRRHGEYVVMWNCPRCNELVTKTYKYKDVAEKMVQGLKEGWLSAICDGCTNAAGI